MLVAGGGAHNRDEYVDTAPIEEDCKPLVPHLIYKTSNRHKKVPLNNEHLGENVAGSVVMNVSYT